MTEKPQENQPSSNFDRLTPQEQSAALSGFLEAEAEKKNGAAAERLRNRDFFSQRAVVLFHPRELPPEEYLRTARLGLRVFGSVHAQGKPGKGARATE